MKRTRENEPDGDSIYRGESPFLTQFEVVNGLTKKRAGMQDEVRDAAFRRLCSTSEKRDVSKEICDLNLSILFEDLEENAVVSACCTNGPHKLLDSIITSMDSTSYVTFISTVQLVAHDGHSLVMASSLQATEPVADMIANDRDQIFHQQARSTLQRLKFDKRLGEVFPGDTLLLQVVENKPPDTAGLGAVAGNRNASDSENGSSSNNTLAIDTDRDNSCNYGDHLVVNAEFLTFDTNVFSNVDEWRDAVRSNVAAVCTWMAGLSAQPPGLPQLSYIQACVLGNRNSEGPVKNASEVRIDGWARSLQLPLLLKVSDELMGSFDRKTLDLLRRAILSVLRLFVSVFVHASAIIPLPSLYQTLFISFVASPLFLDGFSTVLSDTAGSIGSLTWGALTAALRDSISLCMNHLCNYTPAVLNKDDVGNFLLANASFNPSLAPRAISARLLAALGSFETLMHRLSATWLLTNSPQSHRNVNRHAHRFRKSQRVSEALEELAIQGVIQGVAQWLQYKELNDVKASSLTSGDSSHPQSDGAHGLRSLLQPPTLAHIEETQLGSRKTAEEELEAMRNTYTPYLTRDAMRFVETASRAAYAELYDPALRATHTFLASSSQFSPESGRNIVSVRVVSVRFPALHPQLSEYSWHDVRHHAEFGMPVFLKILPNETFPSVKQKNGETETRGANASVQGLQHAIRQTAAADRTFHSSEGCLSEDGSCFANIVIRLQGRPVLFPVVITNLFTGDGDGDDDGEVVAGSQVKAYVMRDVDMLAEFVETSAAMEASGLPDAWLVTASDLNPGDAVDMEVSVQNRRLTRPLKRRLLPVGTPALTYIDIIKLLVMLRDELSCGMSYDALAVGKDKAMRWTAPHPHQQLHNGVAKVVSSLWLWYFATGELPTQQNAYSLSSANRAITGDGGQAAAQDILQTLVESGPFTLAQVEALHALCGSSSVSTTGGSPLAGIRVAGGCAGAGKTTVLYTCSAVRGEQMAVARKEHQISLQPVIKRATAEVKRAAAELHAAVSAVAPFTDADVQEILFSPGDTEKNEEEAILADALEGFVAAVEAQGVEFVHLSRVLRYCSPSLLLRNDAIQEELPPSVIKLLHLPSVTSDRGLGGEDRVPSSDEPNTREAPLHGYHRIPLRGVVAESHRRARHAPLAATLERHLARLRQLGDVLTALQRAMDGKRDGTDPLPPLHAALLPLLLSGREVREVTAAASGFVPSVPSQDRRPGWASYVQDGLWATTSGAVTTTPAPSWDPPRAAHGKPWEPHRWVGGPDWEALRPRREAVFAPVEMPSTMHLPLLSPDQAAGWWRVYAEKQVELIQHLREHIHRSVRQVFQIFLDLINGVAAVSQVTKQQVVVCNEQSLLKHLNLPFLWVWSPSQVFIDDLDKLNDGMLLALPSANSVTLSLNEKLPVYTERFRCHAAMVLLRSLRKELQERSALSIALLSEPMRCDKDVLQTALAKLCTHDARFSSVGTEKENNEEGDVDNTARDEAGYEASENDFLTKQAKPCLPGFVSCSPLEVWTHSVPLSMNTEADTAAAAFLLRYHAQYDRTKSFHIFYPLKGAFSESRRHLTALNPEDSGVMDDAAGASYMRVCVPWFDDTPEEAELGREPDDDELTIECEVGVICLSSLVWCAAGNTPRMAATTALGGSQHSLDASGSDAWHALLQEAEGVFHQRLCDWLWRVLSRVRCAAVIIGCRELFMRVPVLQEMERFVVQQRRALAPHNPHLKYWLPSKVAGSVLALCCPEHYKCRRIASICLKENHIVENSLHIAEKGCYVKILGEERCQSVCLHSFDHCENRSHVCLLACHLTGYTAPRSRFSINEEGSVHSGAGNADKAENQDMNTVTIPTSPHTACLYPCCKLLQCGHVCNRVCGEPCEPCSFVGLRELSCGQRVVSGINSTDMTIQYTFFAHFQEARCGAPPRRCEVPVTICCPRCCHKSTLPCFQLTEHEQRLSGTVKKQDGSEIESQSVIEGEDTFVLSRLQCPGCVALYNKVATKHGLEELPAPLLQKCLPGASLPDQEEEAEQNLHGAGDPEAQDSLNSLPNNSQFPLHLLSTDARRDLEHAFVLAKKKYELLLKKEGLEISSGRLTAPGAKPSDFVVCREQYNAQKVAQVQQEERWKDLVNEQIQHWAQRLRQQVEKQVSMNARMENTWPLLVSEAEAEIERQQQSV
ncbi:unnamed protein product [Phytomonas sp. EM1]|nr:unnamed protein product [Phytomonas sp. EM1]|eukprot:CCW63070.1 unnamed protein product [Phytomonas sp. isolate EM1]